MEYQCKQCEWNGRWEELILETLCPKCRSSVQLMRDTPTTARPVTQPASPPVTSPPQ